MHRFDGDKIAGPPTMVCEVSGKRSRKRDYGAKMRAYYRFQVPWYWVVDLVEQQVKEYRHGAEGYELVAATPFGQTFRPALFPGLEIVVPPGEEHRSP